MADAGEMRRWSDTEWSTIYSRIPRIQQPSCIRNTEINTINDTSASAAVTRCMGTQTDMYDITEDALGTLMELAHEIVRVVDVYADADRAPLSQLRLLLGCEQSSGKLFDLTGLKPGEYCVIGQDVPTNRESGESASRRTNKEQQTHSIVSVLIGEIIEKSTSSGPGDNLKSTIKKNNDTKSLMEGIHMMAAEDTGLHGSHTERDAVDMCRSSRKSSTEDESGEVSYVMSVLGYGPAIRNARVCRYRAYDRLLNVLLNDRVAITAGSKGEGLTCCYESDLDCILVLKRVVCVEKGIDLNTIPVDISVLIMDTRVYPGHCRLLLERRAHIVHPVVLNALCVDDSGFTFLGSDLFVNACPKPIQPEEISHARAGPSLPSTFRGVFNTDIVHALRCHCPNILRTWAERPRHWPPPAIVQKVVSLGAFVTPIGFKGSENKDVEWRICFNTGESELITNLNDTQVKVYVILKMIVKDVLKPLKKEITSYTLKNIVLWLAENNKQEMFHAMNVLHWLREGLRELITAISTKHLSYYMIPKRNLMAACGLEDWQQRTWVATITDMIDEGPKILLRLKKIRHAIISYPEPLLWYNKMRTELEILMQELMNRDLECSDETGATDESDVVLEEIWRRMDEIPEVVSQRLLVEGIYVNDLQDLLNVMLM